MMFLLVIIVFLEVTKYREKNQLGVKIENKLKNIYFHWETTNTTSLHANPLI